LNKKDLIFSKHVESNFIVKLLYMLDVEDYKPFQDNNFCFIENSIIMGESHIELTNVLLQHPKFKTRTQNKVLHTAIEFGNFEVVKLLVKNYNVDLSIDSNKPIRTASYLGYHVILKFLLKYKSVSPEDLDNWAMLNSYKSKQNECVVLLWNFKNVRSLLKEKNNDIYNILNKKFIKYKVINF
jgi:ankyrin repeat protein